MAQLMSLPLTVSCFSKIQIGFTFLVPAGSAIKVLVAIHYSVLDARNGYIRNVVV